MERLYQFADVKLKSLRKNSNIFIKKIIIVMNL